MKKYNILLLMFVIAFLCCGSCKEQQYQAGKPFIIQNNSDKEIVAISQGAMSFEYEFKNLCRENLTKFEYYDIIRDCMVSPYSNKNVERQKIAEYMMEHPNDTVHIIVFYRLDMDKKPCKKTPVKKLWKVTLSDMEACNWTLVYDPKK